jgi:hypothetical protein
LIPQTFREQSKTNEDRTTQRQAEDYLETILRQSETTRGRGRATSPARWTCSRPGVRRAEVG